MKRFNFHRAELEADTDEPDGYRAPSAAIAPAIGAARLAGTVALLRAGESLCPYHYELGEEEWLLVLEGTPSVRTPPGTDTLEPGDVVCFPRGPDGAHKIFNAAAAPARVIVISEHADVASAVYEDSDKIGVFATGVRLLFRRGEAVDYWDGERPHNDDEPPGGGSRS